MFWKNIISKFYKVLMSSKFWQTWHQPNAPVWYEVPMSEMPSEIPPMVLQRTFKVLPQPKFQLGEWCVGFRCPTGTLVELLASFTLMKQVVKYWIALFSLTTLKVRHVSCELWLCLWRRPPTHLSTTTKFSQRKSCPRLRINCYKSNQMFMSPRLQLPLGGGYEALAEICCL